MHLGIFNRDSPADREIMLGLLDAPKETSMTWDGIPEHRNLRGGDGEQPEAAGDGKREASGWPGFGPEPDPATMAEVLRMQAERLARQSRQPGSPQMPADPFDGMTAGATAMHEMFRSMVASGFTEQQVLFYLACLMQVGNALKQGGLLPPEET